MTPFNSTSWALPPADAYVTGISNRATLNIDAGIVVHAQDCLIEELPVSLEFNGEAAIVMMATPTDLEAFALGFALSEGIIDHPNQMLELHAVPAESGMAVVMTLADGLWQRAQARKRDRAAGSSCSLCGLADMQEALHAPIVAPSELRFKPKEGLHNPKFSRQLVPSGWFL